jgi:hypothetical protein
MTATVYRYAQAGHAFLFQDAATFVAVIESLLAPRR